MSKTKAPRPGVGARAAAAGEAKEILVIVIGDEEFPLAWRNLPMSERMLVRKWTGLPYSEFTASSSTIDADSIALLWCLSRRAAGEKTLVFNDALVAEYHQALEAVEGNIDLRVDTPDDLEDLSDDQVDSPES